MRSSFIERCTIARARFTRIVNAYYAGYLYLEWLYTVGNFGEHRNLYVRDSALLYRRRNVLPRAPRFIPCFKIFTGSVNAFVSSLGEHIGEISQRIFSIWFVFMLSRGMLINLEGFVSDDIVYIYLDFKNGNSGKKLKYFEIDRNTKGFLTKN